MAKKKTTAFFCKECGYESAKWLGQCPGCKQWDTFVEEPIAKVSAGGSSVAVRKQVEAPKTLQEVSTSEDQRIETGIEELDRVLGGGIVIGSLVLVGGDPGIGKSTLLLQMCKAVADKKHKVLYISGEESLKQIKIRAERLGNTPILQSGRILAQNSKEVQRSFPFHIEGSWLLRISGQDWKGKNSPSRPSPSSLLPWPWP